MKMKVHTHKSWYLLRLSCLILLLFGCIIVGYVLSNQISRILHKFLLIIRCGLFILGHQLYYYFLELQSWRLGKAMGQTNTFSIATHCSYSSSSIEDLRAPSQAINLCYFYQLINASTILLLAHVVHPYLISNPQCSEFIIVCWPWLSWAFFVHYPMYGLRSTLTMYISIVLPFFCSSLYLYYVIYFCFLNSIFFNRQFIIRRLITSDLSN